MSVEDRGFIIVEEETSVVVETRLDTSKYRSWSWFMRLAKILLVLCSKAYWYSATFCK